MSESAFVINNRTLKRSSSHNVLYSFKMPNNLIKGILKKCNSENSLINLSEVEEKQNNNIINKLCFNIRKSNNNRMINDVEDEEKNIMNDIIEPVSIECGNKLTDFVEHDHPIDIFGDDYPIRNAMLLLLYTSFKRFKDIPKILNSNDDNICIVFIEILAPIIVNTLMKNLIGTSIHEILHLIK
mgnify:CR=1 FL=1